MRPQFADIPYQNGWLLVTRTPNVIFYLKRASECSLFIKSQSVRTLDLDSFFDNNIMSRITIIIINDGHLGLKLIIAFVKIAKENKTRREKNK